MPDQAIVTIGNFDGVHAGHQAILARAQSLGRQHQLPTTVLTFYPHPAGVVRPGSAPPCLMTRRHKVQALTAAGANRVVVLEPTKQMLALTPETFLKWLVDEHHPRAIVEGRDFRFGKDRLGDVSSLKTIGVELGFDTVIVDPVQVALDDQLLAPVSSSLIRWLLSHGRVGEAARCLTRPYTLTGRVIEGQKRGRHLGVPTANLDLTHTGSAPGSTPGYVADPSLPPPVSTGGRLIPADGVYAGTVTLASGQTYPAAISIGTQPTFGPHARSIEAHLIDFNDDLYDQTITMAFSRWIRQQQPFPDVDALRKQLSRDIQQTRHWHAHRLLLADASNAQPSAVLK